MEQYIKYHKKNIKLRGGSIISPTRKLDIQQNTNMELFVNTVDVKILPRKIEIGDYFFYGKDKDNNDLHVSEEEYDILEHIHKYRKLPDTYTQQEKNNTEQIEKKINKEIEEQINKTQIIDCDKITKINFKFELLKITNIDDLINVLGICDNDVITSYLTGNEKHIKNRLIQLSRYGNPIEIYNTEKEKFLKIYNELKDIFHEFETYISNNKFVSTHIPELGNRHTVGSFNLNIIDKNFIYKKYNDSLLSFPSIYKFIKSCNDAFFYEERIYEGKKVYITIVEIPKIVFFWNINKRIEKEDGYAMKKINGETLRDIKKNDIDYWKQNFNMIMYCISELFKILTLKNILIVDFAYDNVMWNRESRTIYYIDLVDQMFDKDIEEVTRENEDMILKSMYNNVDYDIFY